MDPSKAWSQLCELYTDGDNVWAVKNGVLLGTQTIGWDIDGDDFALRSATIELVRDLAFESLDSAARA